MDTKKIGAFLKQCRKENNLTQEQLAEKFGVSARTVSRWETGSNMPDLSILIELADYYDIEIKELLDGERSSTMNKEMKETLNKVADYEEWVKQKALKAGNLAFASMFLISVGTIIIQLLLTVKLRLVLGETLIALVGGIVYAFLMVHNGIWDKGLSQREVLWRDFLTSVICAGIFSVLYGICLGRMGATEKQTIYLSLLFLGGITIVAFIVLRVLSYFNRKRRRISVNGEQRDIPTSKLGCTKIYNAKDIVEAGRIVELLKEHGIVPDYTAGLSLGEYSALYCAGVFKRQQVIDLARFRGKVMQEAVSEIESEMIAVLGMKEELLQDLCHQASSLGVVSISNYNCPGQLVVAGEKKAVEKVKELALENKARRVISLNTSGPFDTSLLKEASLALKERFKKENHDRLAIVIFQSYYKSRVIQL